VNRQLSRVFMIFAVAFGLLVLWTGYWQIWAEPGLRTHRDNLAQVIHELSIKRGEIRAADGTVLARNRKRRTKDGRTIYLRVYPTRSMFAAPVGYSSPTASRAGIEEAANDYLTGANTDLSGTLSNELRSLTGSGSATGNDVWTSLMPSVQRVAMSDLAHKGLPGAVVALEPSTGKVLALASWPSYDPNTAVDNQRRWQRLQHSSGAALLDRATQGRYVPGSTFKVVTTAAALASGRYTPNSRFVDTGSFTEYGVPIHNDVGEQPMGNVTFTQALTHSINAVYARVGWNLCHGQSHCPALIDQMLRFGFYQVPQLDVPSDQKVASGLLTRQGHLASVNAALDPGRTAIGQYTLGVTPLQMAMVAAGVANHGVVMQPQLVWTVRTPGGHVVARTQPKALGRAVSPQIAAEIGQMMTHVVEEGTGRAAAIPGVQIAGKTGTAQTGVPGRNNAWFIAFAPVDHPKVAVAVLVEKSPTYGGVDAAPIAKDVMQAVLRAHS
jgi:peptidoglycan glycosyltransferase